MAYDCVAIFSSAFLIHHNLHWVCVYVILYSYAQQLYKQSHSARAEMEIRRD